MHVVGELQIHTDISMYVRQFIPHVILSKLFIFQLFNWKHYMRNNVIKAI